MLLDVRTERRRKGAINVIANVLLQAFAIQCRHLIPFCAVPQPSLMLSSRLRAQDYDPPPTIMQLRGSIALNRSYPDREHVSLHHKTPADANGFTDLRQNTTGLDRPTCERA